MAFPSFQPSRPTLFDGDTGRAKRYVSGLRWAVRHADRIEGFTINGYRMGIGRLPLYVLEVRLIDGMTMAMPITNLALTLKAIDRPEFQGRSLWLLGVPGVQFKGHVGTPEYHRLYT